MRSTAILVIPVLGLGLGCGGTDEPVEYPDAVAADPGHYTVEFENDVVRVLRIAYGPGETSVMHHHPPNCAIFLHDQPTTMETPDGEVVEQQPSDLGTVTCSDQGEDHLPTNAGDEGLELILVEFVEGGVASSDAMPEAPHAVTADPDHYSVEYENDVARLVRVRYGPGEASTMHHHPAYCAVYLTDQPQVTFELPDGEVVEAPTAELGAVNCVDAEAHLPTNVGEAPIEVVLLEFKGRATAAN